MRTRLPHSRQLPLKSAAGKLPCDHPGQRNAERCVGNWNRKSDENIEKQNTTKIQQQTFNINAHRSVAFTSASAEISSWQAAV